MPNLLTIMGKANSEYISLEDYGIKGVGRDLFYDLANRCGFKVLEQNKKGKVCYKLKKLCVPCERLYSREERSTFNYADFADLHIGHEDCELNRIKIYLEGLARSNVDYIFISGDVFEGVSSTDENIAKKEFDRQLDLAFRLFRDIPLDIRVQPGNHDFSFDLAGIYNPLKTLETFLLSERCNFKVYDSYIQDFEIAGIVKRMMHLENYYYCQNNVYPAIFRLHEFDQNEGLSIKCVDGIKRPIRFFQCGHIHKKAEFFDSDCMVYVTQPGSFIKNENYYAPFIHVKGEVTEDLRIIRG